MENHEQFPIWLKEAVDRDEHWTNVSIYNIDKSLDAEISNFFKSKIQSFQNEKGLQS